MAHPWARETDNKPTSGAPLPSTRGRLPAQAAGRPGNPGSSVRPAPAAPAAPQRAVAAAAAIFQNPAASSAAPPTSAPSMSVSRNSVAALPALTLPP